MLVHRTWDAENATPSVAIYDDRMVFQNPGHFPMRYTWQDFIDNQIGSLPENPTIANVFYRSGMMESWGRGIGLIMETCEKAGLPKPTIEVSVSFVNLTIFFAEPIDETKHLQETSETLQVTLQDKTLGNSRINNPTIQDTIQVAIQVKNMLYAFENKELSSSEIREKLGLINRSHFTKEYLSPALEQDLIEMTIPDKPNSRFQKYRLTEKGKSIL